MDEQAELLAAEDGAVPEETWDSVNALPELPTPSTGELCCERTGGCILVGMIISFCVASVVLTTSAAVPSAAYVGTLCRYAVYTEAAIALSFLFALQYLGLGVIKRNPQTCFPLPEVVAERLRRNQRAAVQEQVAKGGPSRAPRRTLAFRLRAAVEGQGNIHDPDGLRGVYCVRCFVWRPEDGHHCSECQRCVPEFDHHCGVLGCCVNGGGRRGNMWLFIGLISMAAVGFATALLTGLLVGANGGMQPLPGSMTRHHLPRNANGRTDFPYGRGQPLPHTATTRSALLSRVRSSSNATAGRLASHRFPPSRTHSNSHRGLLPSQASPPAAASARPPLQSNTVPEPVLAATMAAAMNSGVPPLVVRTAAASLHGGDGAATGLQDVMVMVSKELGVAGHGMAVATATALGLYAFWRGFMWLFYDRHSHLRRPRLVRAGVVARKPAARRVAVGRLATSSLGR